MAIRASSPTDAAATKTIDQLGLNHALMKQFRKAAIEATLGIRGRGHASLDLHRARARLNGLRAAEQNHSPLEPFCFVLKQALQNISPVSRRFGKARGSSDELSQALRNRLRSRHRSSTSDQRQRSCGPGTASTVAGDARDHTQSVPSPCSRSAAPRASPPRWRKRLMPGGDHVKDRERTPPMFPSRPARMQRYVTGASWG